MIGRAQNRWLAAAWPVFFAKAPLKALKSQELQHTNGSRQEAFRLTRRFRKESKMYAGVSLPPWWKAEGNPGEDCSPQAL